MQTLAAGRRDETGANALAHASAADGLSTRAGIQDAGKARGTIPAARLAAARVQHLLRWKHKERLSLRVRPLRRWPALSLWPGDTPAHDAKRLAEPKRRISVLI